MKAGTTGAGARSGALAGYRVGWRGKSSRPTQRDQGAIVVSLAFSLPSWRVRLRRLPPPRRQCTYTTHSPPASVPWQRQRRDRRQATGKAGHRARAEARETARRQATGMGARLPLTVPCRATYCPVRRASHLCALAVASVRCLCPVVPLTVRCPVPYPVHPLALCNTAVRPYYPCHRQ